MAMQILLADSNAVRMIPGGLSQEAHQFTLRHLRRAAQIRKRHEPEQRCMRNAFARDVGVMHARCQTRHHLDTAFPVEAGSLGDTRCVEVNLFHFSPVALMLMLPESSTWTTETRG
jgi:hypothetical protein